MLPSTAVGDGAWDDEWFADELQDEPVEPFGAAAVVVSDDQAPQDEAKVAPATKQAAVPARGVQDSYYSRRAESQRSVAPQSLAPTTTPPAEGDLFEGVQRAALETNMASEYGGDVVYDEYVGEGGEYGYGDYVDGEFAGDCYGQGCAGGCDSCGGGRRLFGGCCADLWTDVHARRYVRARFDYLSWWERGSSLPPLVTTSLPGTVQTDAGVLGEAATSVLVGDERVLDDQRSGGRVEATWWVGGGEWCGIDGDYLQLQTASALSSFGSTFSGGATGGQILARPFFNATLGEQDAQIVAFPQFLEPLSSQLIDLDGRVRVESQSDVQSAGLGLRRLLWIDFDAQYRVYLTGGYRFWRFDDNLTISDQTFPVGGFFAPGSQIATFDQFDVKNEFHGGDVGLATEIRRGCWSVELMAKLAMGNNHQVIQINGQTLTSDGTAVITTPGGLLTQNSNIGTFRRDEFALIPQFSANLSYQITSYLRAQIGYTFTYWFDVVRAADQIDEVVNLDQATNPLQRPAVPYGESDFWLQGVNGGVELSF